MSARNPFLRLFSCQFMLKPAEVQGDLPTTKAAYRTVLAIAWPSIVESVLVCLMTSIDTMMVGTLSPAAIAAVGLTNQPRFILLALITSINIGITALVSRRRGAGDVLGANSCLKQCLLLNGVLSVLLSSIGAIFAHPIMTLAGAGGDIVDMSASYFRLTMIGISFLSLGLTITAAQRGVGNTRISMVTNIAANVVNVIFNYCLIHGVGPFPALGVDGAAIATVMGNVTSFGIALFSVLSVKRAHFLTLTDSASWRFDRRTLKGLFQVGGSAFVEQVFMRIGFFLYAWMIAQLGTAAFATHQIGMQIWGLSFAVGEGFSIAASALMGRNLGAGRPDLSKLYTSVIQRLAIIASTVVALIFFFLRHTLIELFTTDPAIIEAGSILMIIMACTTHVQTSQVIISGSLRGAGDTRFTAIVSFISVAVVRPILTWLFCFPLGLGLFGAWFTIGIDQGMRFVVNFIRFLGGKWSKISL